MYRIVFSPQADQDIIEIIRWTVEFFGTNAADRYIKLLDQAFTDLRKDPLRMGTQQRDELAKGAYSYHLRHSRDRVRDMIRIVRNPKHFVIFRVLKNNILEIGRVLHDARDLERHLPQEYKS